METLAKNSHGLWAATAVEAPETRPLQQDHETDVAVIGAGFTGLNAALALRAAGRDVTVLDGGEIGQGCSGRNGGQVNPGWKMDLSDIANHYGRNHAGAALDLAKSAVPALSSLIRNEGLRCEFIENGYVQGAIGAQGLASINQRASQWMEHGIEAEVLSGPASAALLGTDAYEGVMLHSQGGNLHPLSYARELGRLVIEHGGTIFTGSRALWVTEGDDQFAVVTDGGTLYAKTILLATNGYTDLLWPGLAQAVVPVASALSSTAPLSPEVAAAILPGRHSVSETRRIQVYYRMTEDKRFVIGGRGATFGAAENSSTAEVRRIAQRYFPVLNAAEWTHDWAGTVAMTWDHAPKLMRLADRVYAGMGYNGRGVAMATAMGYQLARASLGEPTDLPITPLYRTPFHAFRKLGIFSTVLRGRILDGMDHRSRR